MAFSPDGKYLSLGSTNGAVSVWSMSNSLHQNVKQVLEGIRL
jgi:WD40 repeat protein